MGVIITIAIGGFAVNLIHGEKLNWKTIDDVGSANIVEDEITYKYSKGETRIVTEQARYPLNTIVSMVKSGNYTLRPDFQRRHRWDNKRKSKLIESFIINVPIPPVFLYEISYSKYEIMDGLQRISTIDDFYNDRFQLEGLDEWAELNGYHYSKLPEIIKLGIDRRYLSSIILLQETAKDNEVALKMKQLVFERLNSGGIDLSSQEIRNAIYDGKLNKLCMEKSRNEKFRKLWGIPLDVDKKNMTSDNKLYSEMEDVELILRFFAFRQIEAWQSNVQKFFFDDYLIKGNNFEDSVLSALGNVFEKTIELIYNVFGKNAFCLYRKRKSSEKLSLNKKPSKVLYDSLMLAFCQYLDNEPNILQSKDSIEMEYKKLFHDKYDIFESRFNKSDIVNRTNEIKKIIEKVLGE